MLRGLSWIGIVTSLKILPIGFYTLMNDHALVEAFYHQGALHSRQIRMWPSIGRMSGRISTTLAQQNLRWEALTSCLLDLP